MCCIVICDNHTHIHIYTFTCRIKDTIKTSGDFFKKIHLSLYCKVCVWEGVGHRTELQYIDPHSIVPFSQQNPPTRFLLITAIGSKVNIQQTTISRRHLWCNLLSLFIGISTLVGDLIPKLSLKKKLVEVQFNKQLFGKSVYTFSNGINLKVNIVTQQEFYLAYCDSAVQ